MQTFLPYPEFERSAAVLDPRRLGKQRVEVLQILRALHFTDYGWRNHPAVTMWRGYVDALVAYGVAVTNAWAAAGRPDTCAPQIVEFAPARTQADLAAAGRLPPWLGWSALHRSHHSALVRKDPVHYRQFFPDVPDDLDYVWPEPLPHEERPSRPLTAWIVRAAGAEIAEVFRRDDVVGLTGFGDVTVPTGGRTKRQRQVRRFAEAVVIGDPVAVPVEAGLLVGPSSATTNIDLIRRRPACTILALLDGWASARARSCGSPLPCKIPRPCSPYAATAGSTQ
jgi:hypothetical protein